MENEYPKILYKIGWEDLSENVIVNDKSEEGKAKKDGYKPLSEIKEK